MRGEMKNKAQENKQAGFPPGFAGVPDTILHVNAVSLFPNLPEPGPGHSSKEAARTDL